MRYYSTNNNAERVDFDTALLNGMASNNGLYMPEFIPRLSQSKIKDMKGAPYADIAYTVLSAFLDTIPSSDLKSMLDEAYDESVIPTKVQQVADNKHILWLTKGPTYSFKDYAARFYGRALNYVLGKRGERRTVFVATSGDTGGAIADALYGLENIDVVIFYPKNSISKGQRRQMTTLKNNVYAYEVNGDFDVCQALAKYFLRDKQFALDLTGDKDNFTSANSISIGRLLPQSVFPFYAYAHIDGDSIIPSICSGNFGDMMGTVLAREMGLSLEKILIGLNPNKPFERFIETGIYTVTESIPTPSSAMKVTHPSNLARLVDVYGGHMFDELDKNTGKVKTPGKIDAMPNLAALRNDFFVHSISNQAHYHTMREVFDKFGILLDPHGAVSWSTLEKAISLYPEYKNLPVIAWGTADPGKFPDDVKKATGVIPDLPEGMKKQASLPERIYSISSASIETENGKRLSDAQIAEAKGSISSLLKAP